MCLYCSKTEAICLKSSTAEARVSQACACFHHQVENPEYTSDALRHHPIGEDARGNRYYYFSTNNEDCRLYREEPPGLGDSPKDLGLEAEVGEATWATQTTTLEELQVRGMERRGMRECLRLHIRVAGLGMQGGITQRQRGSSTWPCLSTL